MQEKKYILLKNSKGIESSMAGKAKGSRRKFGWLNTSVHRKHTERSGSGTKPQNWLNAKLPPARLHQLRLHHVHKQRHLLGRSAKIHDSIECISLPNYYILSLESIALAQLQKYSVLNRLNRLQKFKVTSKSQGKVLISTPLKKSTITIFPCYGTEYTLQTFIPFQKWGMGP